VVPGWGGVELGAGGGEKSRGGVGGGTSCAKLERGVEKLINWEGLLCGKGLDLNQLWCRDHINIGRKVEG